MFSLSVWTLQGFSKVFSRTLLAGHSQCTDCSLQTISLAHGQAGPEEETSIRNDEKKWCEVGFWSRIKPQRLWVGLQSMCRRASERERWQIIRTLKLPELSHTLHSPKSNITNINHPEVLLQLLWPHLIQQHECVSECVSVRLRRSQILPGVCSRLGLLCCTPHLRAHL